MIAFLVGLLASTSAIGAPSSTAFVNVTVVSTDRDRQDPHRNVVIRSGRIETVSATAKLKPPAHFLAIDGRGRYLIPGLVDTHVHLFGYSRAGEGDPKIEDAILRMLVANGVTTALVMEGSLAVLHLRAELAAGRRTGPMLYSAGLLIQAPDTGAPPGRKTFSTPEDVQREVEEEKRLGYDFVKVHGAMPRETYAALVETAHRLGLPVIGHVPDNLGIDAALGGGQVMIAHAESYLQTDFEFNRKLPNDRAA